MLIDGLKFLLVIVGVAVGLIVPPTLFIIFLEWTDKRELKKKTKLKN
jgi:hypothetical protein